MSGAMDGAMNEAGDHPLRGIDHVALRVRDLPAMTAFHADLLGLEPIHADATEAALGAGGRVLMRLISDPAARPRDPRHPGLFHTAILLPDRPALGRFLRHAAARGARLSGASDHGVSEALYLSDPEGNGLEIYRDRPASDWVRDGARIVMTTRRLDLDALAQAADGPWRGAPEGTTIGHVHLQVGNLAAARAFCADRLELAQTFDAPGGAWFGWDGYHHHLAVNSWNSAGAGPRPAGEAGLDHIALRHDPGIPGGFLDFEGNRFVPDRVGSQ